MDETGKWDYCGSLTEDNKLVSILTLAENAGMSTGFVSTARVTHQSQSPLYAHSVSGDWESDKDILEQAKDDASSCADIGKLVVNKFNRLMYTQFFFYYFGMNVTAIHKIVGSNKKIKANCLYLKRNRYNPLLEFKEVILIVCSFIKDK